MGREILPRERGFLRMTEEFCRSDDDVADDSWADTVCRWKVNIEDETKLGD